MKVIPQSIGHLQCLETLNLKYTEVADLPIEILKIKMLRHLLVYKCNPDIENRPFFDFIHIEADQMGDTTIVREIGRLTQLRRLGIFKLRREDRKDLCSSLDKLTELHTLTVVSTGEDEIIDMEYPLNLKYFRTLCLLGRLEKVPQWVPSLHSLTRVVLTGSKLSNDPLESLQDLPRLADLGLDGTFEGEKLEFKAGKFLHLETLGIRRLNGLRKIRVEKCSMPNLDKLYLGLCKLVELPVDFEHLNKLQYFENKDMSKIFVEALENQKRSEGSNWKLAHVLKFVVFAEDGKPRGRYSTPL